LMALSLGTAREQFVQRTNRTWPRPCLLRLYWLVRHYARPHTFPPFLPFFVILPVVTAVQKKGVGTAACI